MTVTASMLRQHFHLLDEAQREPITVTKRGRPYVVILDYETYQQLIKSNKNHISKTVSTPDRKLRALETLGTYELGGKKIRSIKTTTYDPT